MPIDFKSPGLSATPQVLYDLDLTGLATADLGAAAGAKSIDGKTWTLTNSGTYLDANASVGLHLELGVGLHMQTAALASIPDINGSLCAYLDISLQDLLGTTFWSATEATCRRDNYPGIWVACVFDATDTDASQQTIGVGLGESSTYAKGALGLVGYDTTEARVGTNTAETGYQVDMTTLAGAGLAALPTAMCHRFGPAGNGCWFGTASGIEYPATWGASTVQVCNASAQINPTTDTGIITSDSRLVLTVGDTGGDVVDVILKRLTVMRMHTSFAQPFGGRAGRTLT